MTLRVLSDALGLAAIGQSLPGLWAGPNACSFKQFVGLSLRRERHVDLSHAVGLNVNKLLQELFVVQLDVAMAK